MIKFMLDQTKMKTSQRRVNKHNQHAKGVKACKHNYNA